MTTTVTPVTVRATWRDALAAARAEAHMIKTRWWVRAVAFSCFPRVEVLWIAEPTEKPAKGRQA